MCGRVGWVVCGSVDGWVEGRRWGWVVWVSVDGWVEGRGWGWVVCGSVDGWMEGVSNSCAMGWGGGGHCVG